MQCSVCGSNLTLDSKTCPKCEAIVAIDGTNLDFATPAKSSLPQMGSTFAGRYRIEKYLGLGSLCNAYLCRDLNAGNSEVVLKIMHTRKAAEPGMSESFLFLAESVSQYNHKGIAKIYDFGNQDGFTYYTMEWVSGVPLRLWLMERLNFENRVLPGLGLIRNLLETFEVIQERGCYGCLKPENVFITLNGPVVMDFGTVGFLNPQEFEFNTYARRYLPYMAPELRQDWSNLLPQSDTFSIGALLYEILVARAPAAPLKLPSELSSLFNIDTDEIILKSMAQRPNDRFSTLHAFKQAIEALQGRFLQAHPLDETKADANEAEPEQTLSQSHLDFTSDIQDVHNPDLIFSNPEPAAPHTLVFEPTIQFLREEPISELAQTQFTPEPAPKVSERVRSEFVPVDPPSYDFTKPEDLVVNESEIEPEPEPVPAWVFVIIALTGIFLVALSAYFGLRIRL